jgi:hypothetical protein
MVPLHENDNEKALFKNGLILAITSDNPPFLEIDNHNKEIIRNHRKSVLQQAKSKGAGIKI